MTNLQMLNSKMLELERKGDIGEDDYRTYKALLEWLEFSTTHIGDRLPIRDSQTVLKKLYGAELA